MVKIRQKISGCRRTLTGARQFAAIRSYTATTRKHNINLYDALSRLANGTPWLPVTRIVDMCARLEYFVNVVGKNRHQLVTL